MTQINLILEQVKTMFTAMSDFKLAGVPLLSIFIAFIVMNIVITAFVNIVRIEGMHWADEKIIGQPKEKARKEKAASEKRSQEGTYRADGSQHRYYGQSSSDSKSKSTADDWNNF